MTRNILNDLGKRIDKGFSSSKIKMLIIDVLMLHF